MTPFQFIHLEKYFRDSFQIESNKTIVTVFLLIMNQTEVRLVHNQNEYCRNDRIFFNLKGIREKILRDKINSSVGRCLNRNQLGINLASQCSFLFRKT